MGAVSAVKESATDTQEVQQEVVADDQEVDDKQEVGVVFDEFVKEVVLSDKSSVSSERGVSPSLPSTRPRTPTRPPLEAGPTFEPPAPLPPPPKAHLLQRALSALGRKAQRSDRSILASCVGVYAAHATLLTAAVLGTFMYSRHTLFIGFHKFLETPLGQTAMDVVHHVAMETAEDVMAASSPPPPG